MVGMIPYLVGQINAIDVNTILEKGPTYAFVAWIAWLLINRSIERDKQYMINEQSRELYYQKRDETLSARESAFHEMLMKMVFQDAKDNQQ